MEEDIIIKTLEHQEGQLLSMRRELNGIHASITDIEVRINLSRILMLCTGIVLILFAVWIWFS